MGRPGYLKDGAGVPAVCSEPSGLPRIRGSESVARGVMCPKCSGTSAWLHATRSVFECRQGGRQTSPLAET